MSRTFAEEVDLLKKENHTFAEEVDLLKKENHTFAKEVDLLKKENKKLGKQITDLQQQVTNLEATMARREERSNTAKGLLTVTPQNDPFCVPLVC